MNIGVGKDEKDFHCVTENSQIVCVCVCVCVYVLHRDFLVCFVFKE